jgi:integrase
LEESTIEAKVKLVKHLASKYNIWDSDSIRQYIYKAKWGGRRRNNAGYAYMDWCKWKGFEFTFEKFKEETQSLPYIPLEKEIDQLIAGCSRRLIPLLQLLKETGVRIGEATRIKWIDIDFENRTVRITPEKGSNPRILPLSNTLKAALLELQASSKPERLFPNTPRDLRRAYQIQRKRIASNLHNPRISKITFHTFRHFKATMEYYRTKDVFHVKNLATKASRTLRSTSTLKVLCLSHQETNLLLELLKKLKRSKLCLKLALNIFTKKTI